MPKIAKQPITNAPECSKKDPFADLANDIKNAYEGNVTMEEAERLAAKFLGAMMQVSALLKSADLDARMKKSGVKAVRAAIYLEEAAKGERKPSDVMLNALLDQSKLVQDEQLLFDKAEVSRDELERYFGIFKEGHLYFRAIGKGRFE